MGCLKLLYHQHETTPANQPVCFFHATSKSASASKIENNYYPFGSLQPDRNWNSDQYRYGFNGQEADNEVKGTGNQQDYGARIYDPRLGRFSSLDPRMREYPFFSPYLFAANNPIRFIDVNGEGPGDRVKAARQFLNRGWTYSNQKDNYDYPPSHLRTAFSNEALRQQDCVEMVLRIMYADEIFDKVPLVNASAKGLGIYLFDKTKYINSKTPQVGDIAFWEGHTGIVSYVDEETGRFRMIHAENHDAGIIEDKYLMTSSSYGLPVFYGFFRPINETPDGKAIDVTQPRPSGERIFFGGTLSTFEVIDYAIPPLEKMKPIESKQIEVSSGIPEKLEPITTQ